jgi:hypothetical protein
MEQLLTLANPLPSVLMEIDPPSQPSKSTSKILPLFTILRLKIDPKGKTKFALKKISSA